MSPPWPLAALARTTVPSSRRGTSRSGAGSLGPSSCTDRRTPIDAEIAVSRTRRRADRGAVDRHPPGRRTLRAGRPAQPPPHRPGRAAAAGGEAHRRSRPRVRRLGSREYGWTLEIAGAGPRARRLASLAERLGIARRTSDSSGFRTDLAALMARSGNASSRARRSSTSGSRSSKRWRRRCPWWPRTRRARRDARRPRRACAVPAR